MSKPVLGLLAGLAALAVAGRARKGSFNEERDFGTFTRGLAPQKVIREAAAHHVGEAGVYPMELVGSDRELVPVANRRAGIRPARFNGAHGKTGFRYTADELVDLLAVLNDMDSEGSFEEDEEAPGNLRSSILETLGIEEV